MLRRRFSLIKALVAGLSLSLVASAGAQITPSWQSIEALESSGEKFAETIEVSTSPGEQEKSWIKDGLEQQRQGDTQGNSFQGITERYMADIHGRFELLRNDVFPGSGEAVPGSLGEGAIQILGSDERVYVFVSSSMPLAALRNYAADISRLQEDNVVMVLRGFVGGAQKMGPTMEFIESVLRVSEDCPLAQTGCEGRNVHITVDPLLFERYGVERVPAVVVARGVQSQDEAQSEGKDEVAVREHFTVSGDARLGYALELVRRESSSPWLVALQERLGNF
ncbi:type-F conjugative transfer system pilin assembly protein TrbC [Geoalkalibacter halelectricus]|uniref:type-F conjugative transfer system pilin assembly protein TrbC n=1 Tax=Geoalkalibacter halelectricus TaxID=2847045 RepID=UPI00266F3127|nr:type-F conjugative transfer system pilin assembly protein TrbC [Geoalkalibacter halelectricus]MDO3380347.1 type-F conjugative transfer system pilin assembly protein TrbC [Geoalkalibacter halelectricus]